MNLKVSVTQKIKVDMKRLVNSKLQSKLKKITVTTIDVLNFGVMRHGAMV